MAGVMGTALTQLAGQYFVSDLVASEVNRVGFPSASNHSKYAKGLLLVYNPNISTMPVTNLDYQGATQSK